MKTKLFLTLFLLACTACLFAVSAQEKPAVTMAAKAELPATISASREQSLAFTNLILQAQLMEAQSRELSARAQLIRADLPSQIQAIMREAKIDPTRYTVAKDKNGNFVTDEEGKITFVLIPMKGDSK